MCLCEEGPRTPLFAPTAFTTTKSTPTPTTTPDMYRNDCKQLTTGGCPSSRNDAGFLGVVNSTDPASCERMCLENINGECNSFIFDEKDPDGNGVCELWRYTVEEYHGNCTWFSGQMPDSLNSLDRCNAFDYDSSLPCEVKNFYLLKTIKNTVE